MNPDDLEQDMNSLLERLTQKSPGHPRSNAQDPLSSDHFILNRSWEFFKKRVAAIEKQWQEITAARTEENRILKKGMEQLEIRVHELDSQKKSLEELLANFRVARLEDYSQFKKQTDALKMAWEEERITLESQVLKREEELTSEKERGAVELERLKAQLERYSSLIEDFKKGNDTDIGKYHDFQISMEQQIMEKDELLKSEQAKTEILKRELDQRLKAQQDMQADFRRMEDIQSQLCSKIDSLTADLEKKERGVQDSIREIELLKKEKETLFQNWQREKAEWRELWDRSRQIWEKKQQD